MPIRRSLTVLIAAVLCDAALPHGLRAQWASDPAANVILSAAAGDQRETAIAPDGEGGSVIVWTDARSGSFTDVYAQRLDAAGRALWTSGGTAVCTAPDSQLSPAVVSDGTGGAIITWYDFRSGAGDIYAQRLSSSGSALWTPDGVPVSAASGTEWEPVIAADGSGGAIIAWYGAVQDTATDIFAQRLDASGGSLWQLNGVPVCAAAGGQVRPVISPDMANGVLIAWTDFRNGGFQTFAQRVTDAGAMVWEQNGASICPESIFQYEPAIVGDGLGGLVVTWHDFRSGLIADIYAQRLSAGGTRLWADAGVVVCGSPGDQYNPTIATDRFGGAYVAWHDFRGGSSSDVYVQHLDVAGTAILGPNGLRISGAANNQRFAIATPDGIGGAFVAWMDQRNGPNPDLYVQHLESDGSTSLTADGRPLSTAVNGQGPLVATGTGAGAMIAAWEDGRNGTSVDVAADRVVVANRRSDFGLWLGALSGQLSAAPFYGGVSPGAVSGVDPSDLPSDAGVPAESLSIFTLLNPGSGPEGYRQDMRPSVAGLATRAERWELLVQAPDNHPVAVVGTEDRVPAAFRPIAYDDSTGQYYELRSNPTLNYTSSAAPRRFTVLVGDSTPPFVALLSPNGGESILVGVQTTISWNASDPSGLLKHYLYFSTTGSDPYSLIDSAAGSSTSLSWTPVSAAVNGRLRIVTLDSVLNATTDSSDGTFAVISGDSVAYTPSAQYNLMSVPLLQDDMSPSGVFEDDLGFPPFFVYEYNGVAYFTPDTLRLGHGFWFLIGAEIPVDAIGSVQPVVTLPLRLGWNLTGNPFPVPISRSNMRFSRGGAPVGFDQAVLNGWIAGTLYGFNDGGYFDELDVLAVWNGYWVLTARDSLTLTYDVSLGKTTSPLVTPNHQAIAIAARLSGEAGYARDRIAELRMADDSAPLLSVPRPPRAPGGPAVEVAFSRAAADTAGLERYARLTSGREESEWRMEVTASGHGQVELTWDPDAVDQVFPGDDLVLHDHSSGRQVDMRARSAYSFDYRGGSSPFTLRRTGNAADQIPLTLALDQNYPNPFNPATTIRMHIPLEAQVSLRVFDLLGREVTTLVNDVRTPGTYDVSFDASLLGSGMYLYRLRVGEQVLTRKLMLLK